MKGKIIRGFLAVYLALSMAYGGIRAAYLTVAAAMTPPDQVEEQVALAAPSSFGTDVIPSEPVTVSAADPSPEIRQEDAPEDTPVPAAQTEAPEYPADEAEESASPEEEMPEEQPSESEAEPEDQTEQTETITEAPEEAEDEEDDAYISAAPAQDVPSLEDYLSGLRCGRCGRNCFLSNPRCRTGRNKAESAAEEYYAEYGEI